MSTPLTADQLLTAIRAEGATVVESADWRTWNRAGHGAWGPMHGIVIHHTVTEGTARTVQECHDGYPDLPGPLCHAVIAKDGTIHTIGYGRANHAGLGDPDVLSAVIAESSPLPSDNQASVDGNSVFYGFECENLGDGKDPWPEAQLLAIEQVSAGICRAHGWTARSVIGHLEWQPGKIDPKGFTMDSMRARIAARLGHPAPVRSLPAPTRPSVSLSKLIAAARSNAPAAGEPVTYAGVSVVEAALVNEGLLSKTYSDGSYGTTTKTAMSRWQERCGYTGTRPGQAADGMPGKDSLTRLGNKHEFTITT